LVFVKFCSGALRAPPQNFTKTGWFAGGGSPKAKSREKAEKFWTQKIKVLPAIFTYI
jgi:hypothetical protein